MKTILIISLLLIGMMGWGQEAKLSSAYTVRAENGDTAFSTFYIYDDENLEYTDLFYDSKSHLQRKYYRNDTIIKTGIPYGDEWWFHYYNDSIVVPFGFDTTIASVYHLDDSDLIMRKNSPGNVRLYEWENGNMIEEFSDGESEYTATYDYDYINPFYEEYKYFRLGRDGSYNYINEWGPDGAGAIHKYVVLESIGQYPTIAERYLDGELAYYHYYNYLYVITDIPETALVSATVLSVEYYDIFGRKIPKPQQGLYIERKITNKGIISKKYFIQ